MSTIIAIVTGVVMGASVLYVLWVEYSIRKERKRKEDLFRRLKHTAMVARAAYGDGMKEEREKNEKEK